MATSEPTIRANVLTALPAMAAKHGVDCSSLLTAVGLSEAEIADPERRVSLNAVVRLFELAAARLGDPCFGVHYALAFPPGASGLVGLVTLTAPTIREALMALARYMRLHNSIPTEFHEAEGGGRLRLTWPPSVAVDRLQMTGVVITLIVDRLRRGAGQDWRPLRIDFEHARPADIKEYNRVLGLNLYFNRAANEILVDTATLDRPIPQNLLNLHSTVREAADRQLEDQSANGDVVERANTVLLSRLGTDAPFDLDAVATALGVPARSLQWQLEQRGTSYERLLSETRRVMAERLLASTEKPLTEIASLLSFSELSAFTRAAQRWFGMAPSVYRRELRRKREDEADR